MKLEKITYEEFNIKVRDSDTFSKTFTIICDKCQSQNVSLLWNEKTYGMGSTMTGQWTQCDEQLCFKCNDCGCAWIVTGDDT